MAGDLKIRDWMTPDPVAVTPTTTIASARRTMDEHGFRHLPVVDHGRLVGIVSDRDMRIDRSELWAAVHADGVAALVDDRRSVAEVMSRTPYVLDPDATIAEAARLLVSRHIGALPIVDVDREVVGILTSVDCLRAALPSARIDG